METIIGYYRDQYDGVHVVEYPNDVIDMAAEIVVDVEGIIGWASKQRWKIGSGTTTGTLINDKFYGATGDDVIRTQSNIRALNEELAELPGHYGGDSCEAEIGSVAWIVGVDHIRFLREEYSLLDDGDYYSALYDARVEAATKEISWRGNDGMVEEYPALTEIPRDDWVAALVTVQEYRGETGFFDNEQITLALNTHTHTFDI